MLAAVSPIFGWLLASAVLVKAAGPLDQTYFQPTNRTTGILLPNPPNATCQVLIGLALTGSSSDGPRQPTAEAVPTTVRGNLTFQISNLSNRSVQDAFSLLVDVLPNVIFDSAVGASIGTPRPSARNSSLATNPLNSTQSLGANGIDSMFINTTVVADSQDIMPRTVTLQPTGAAEQPCALGLAGVNPNPVLPAFPPSSG